MGLNFAIDALYATGWTPQDPASCKRSPDGRHYPDEQAVRRAFTEQGCELTIRHIQLFDCYRAEWHDAAAVLAGAVVGQTAEEACVYAMSQLRRQLLATAGARA
jgi:hypothetical protein